ncbi:MAG: DinB family protein [Anaerolineae bacterium]|nr:DinB family protein [Anaerolineae bacterium]
MLDFAPIRSKEKTMHDTYGHFTPAQLRDLTNEMIDTILGLIAECDDEDITFLYNDPSAYDHAAASSEEVNLAWTLGHVIVHITATAEETAFLAAELARGVRREGRSRYEVYWETVTTVEQCRRRLEESRRMRLASLDMWPDEPHLNNTIELRYLKGPINPVSRFLGGLSHEDAHLGQIKEILRQSRAVKAMKGSSIRNL